MRSTTGIQALLTASSVIVSYIQAKSFDYVIIGGGTAGLLVANRLSENPAITVAIIDPGSDQRSNPNTTDPLLWMNNADSPVNWAYASVPQEGLAGRSLDYQAGKGIGGTSLINGESTCSILLAVEG